MCVCVCVCVCVGKNTSSIEYIICLYLQESPYPITLLYYNAQTYNAHLLFFIFSNCLTCQEIHLHLQNIFSLIKTFIGLIKITCLKKSHIP